MTRAVQVGRVQWIIAAVGVALLAILFAQIGPGQILTLLGVLGLNVLAIMALFILVFHTAPVIFLLAGGAPAIRSARRADL